MRQPETILVLHNRYRQRGGEDEVFDREVALLRRKGHRVVEFIEDNEHLATESRLSNSLNAIWSRATVRRLSELIRKERPSIAHFHNTFARISPAAYYACREAGVAVVQTLHNFRIGCLNACCATAQGNCERCVPHLIPLAGIARGCYRNSRGASAAMAAITTTHKLLGTYRKQVDAYIALTDFARQIQIRSGVPEERLFVKPNFVEPHPVSSGSKRGFALFVGRLCPEKGISTLLEAWKQNSGDLPLRIVGEGPSADEVSRAAASMTGIEWLGPRSHAEVMELMSQAAFLIMPSVLYENFPLCLVEAFSAGLPCIVSGHGAMREIVQDQVTGLHFEPRNAADLADKMRWLENNPAARERMGRTAAAEFHARFTPERNYQILTEIYKAAKARRNAKRTDSIDIFNLGYYPERTNGTPIC